MPKKRNRSASSPNKVIRASLSRTIDNPKVSAAVVNPASNKLAVSKLNTVNDDCLFLYGPVAHYFHNVTSRRFRQQLSQNAFSLYERFRPAIPEGVTGWGAKGNLDIDHIRSLALDK